MADTVLDDTRVSSALLVAVIGLIVPAVLAWALTTREGWTASDVTALVSVFTTVVGTLVGAFLGVQVGSAGKQKAENLANRALAALPPETAADVLADR
jgi:uncharacterized protein YacL